jgi:hypothetical protein
MTTRVGGIFYILVPSDATTWIDYSLLVAVRFDVLLGSLTGMLAGMLVMTICQVRMVGSLLVLTGFVVLGSLAMMTGCVGMVLCCMLVMRCCFL